VARTSPAGDKIQLAANVVGDTVAQLERRIHARFGERGLTKAARDLGRVVVKVSEEAGQPRDRLRRMTIAARIASITIVGATLIALSFSLRSAVVEGLAKTADWVPLVDSVINDLVFAAIAVVFLWCFPNDWNADRCCVFCTGCGRWHMSSTCISSRRIPNRPARLHPHRRKRRARAGR
jgi:hypothetical protein